MATLAIAAGGAALGAGVGAAFGGTVLGVSSILFGAQLGFIGGSLAGSLLFAPEIPDQTGPRLQEINISTSTYGRVIPIPYGSVTVAANLIWLGEIVEEKNTQESGGGKGFGGGGGAEVTTFTYFGNFAAAFSEGAINSVRRIWADNNLLVDLTEQNGGKKYKFDRGNYTIYKGDEIQEPDSLIEADLGVGNVPAYRGTAYVVFNKLPLTQFGNRIPNIEAEIVKNVVRKWNVTEDISEFGSAFSNEDILYLDRVDPILWLLNKPLIQKYERFSNQRLVSTTMDEIGPGEREFGLDAIRSGVPSDPEWELLSNAPIVDPAFDLMYLWASNNSTNEPVHMLEFDKDFNFTGFGWRTQGFQSFPKDAVGHVVYNIDKKERLIFSVFQEPGAPLFLNIPNDDWGVVVHDGGLQEDGPPNNRNFGSPGNFVGFNKYGAALGIAAVTFPLSSVVPGDGEGGNATNIAFDPEGKRVWALRLQTSGQGSTFAFNQIICEFDWGSREWDKFIEIGGNPGGWSGFDKVLDVFEATGWANVGITYDVKTGHLIVIGVNEKSSGEDYIRIDPEDYTVVKTAQRLTEFRPTGEWSGAQANSYPNINGLFWVYSFGTGFGSEGSGGSKEMVQIDTVDFKVVDRRFTMPVQTDGSWVIDNVTSAFWNIVGGFDPIPLLKAVFYEGDEGTSIADIARDLAERVGQGPNDIDADELSNDKVAGFVLATESTARGALDPLKVVGAFDAIESDWKIKLRKVDRSPIDTVKWDDLGAEVGSKAADTRLTEPRTQEKDLPIEVSVTGLLQTREYLPSTQTARRWQDQGVAESEGKNNIKIPVVFKTDKEIKQIADRVLFAQWSRRQSQEFSTGPKFLDIDPMDVLTIEKRGSGVQADIPSQIVEMEVGPGGALSFKGRVAEPFLFTDAAVEESVAVATDEISSAGIPVESPSQLFLWDAPPTTRLNTTGSPVWAAGSKFDQSVFEWTGATLLQSSSGQVGTFNSIATTDTAANLFKITQVFPAADVIEDNWNAFDKNLSIQVQITGGEETPSSATKLEVLNGANIALIGKEVIQFLEVTNDGDGKFTLSKILRGRFGTETEMREKRAGTKGVFITLNLDAFQPFTTEETQGISFSYKAATVGLLEDFTPQRSFAHDARGLKPLSPTAIKGSLDGNNDKTITWIRRTRFNGPWKNGTGNVPVNEVFKEYEVDILKAGSVIRTFTNLATETLSYSKSNYDVDFPTSETFDQGSYPNLGFENGNLRSWDDLSGDYETGESSNDLSAAQDGLFFAFNDSGSSSNFSDLTRQVGVTEISVAGNATVELQVQVSKNENSSNPAYKLRFEALDRNGKAIGAVETASADYTAGAGTWTNVGSGALSVPEGATNLKIVLKGERDIAFDNVRLVVTRGATPGRVPVQVYQISDAVGRGQPRKRIV